MVTAMENETLSLSQKLAQAFNTWLETPAAVDRGIIDRDLATIFADASPQTCTNTYLGFRFGLRDGTKEQSFFVNNDIDMVFLRNALAPSFLRETKDLHEQALMAELNAGPSSLTLWHKAFSSAKSTIDAYGSALTEQNEEYILDLMKAAGERTSLALRR